MPKQINTLNFNDTFLSLDHLSASFPQYKVEVRNTTVHVCISKAAPKATVLLTSLYKYRVLATLPSDPLETCTINCL